MATKIDPTIGRVLWFWPEHGRYGNLIMDPGQPLDAHVCLVLPNGTINVGGFDHYGKPYHEHGVQLLQEGDARPETSFCEWMPYQKGQAAKADKP